MYHTNSLIPLLFVAKNYNVPSDITRIIYCMIINNSAQKIIQNWYNYISIHNTNLCYLINKLHTLRAYDTFGNYILYYDLHDISVATTFFICAKYIRPNISSKDWWFNIIDKAVNGTQYVHNFNDPIVEDNLTSINYIYQLINF